MDSARELLGVEYLFPYQRLVVANTLDAYQAAMEGENDAAELSKQIVVLPTGSGKTLCFLLPAAMLPGLTIVVYPLLALMEDQRRRAEEAEIPARILRGGMPDRARRQLFHDIHNGDVKILITNPEMLAVAEVLRHLREVRVSHFVIDEAHCVSEWGLSFRPSYLELAAAIEGLAPIVTSAFTATASDLVLRQVATSLFGDAPVRLVRGNPDRPNISYAVVPVHSKELAMESLLVGQNAIERPAIVFCRSRIRTESYARKLSRLMPYRCVAAYHAGLDREEREEIEGWFFEADDAVLIATCAYGMGVDKKNVRSVIHVDVPPSVEAFLQESGRAGRDGAPASSVFLCSPSDIRSSDARKDIMLGYLTEAGCRRSYLMNAMGSDSDACFGCDACTPDTIPARDTQVFTNDARACAQILQIVERHPRRFTVSHLIPTLPWTKNRCEELINALLVTDRLRVLRKGPWKGTLSKSR
ncbi:MAG: RecQ family ATP-dependent DNA helicase [Spirochaetales bacterium]